MVLAHIIHEFEQVKVGSLSPQTIAEYRVKRIRDGIMESTLKTELAQIKTMLEWSKDNGYIPKNPLDNLRIPKVTQRKSRKDYFTREEIDSAIKRNFIPIHLGASRLRAETAGVAACHSIYFINQ